MTEAAARRIVTARAGDSCEACGCMSEALDWAHRIPRSAGGPWQPANGLQLCRICHGAAHARPVLALHAGWAAEADALDVLADLPVYLAPRALVPGWYLLDETDPAYRPLDRSPIPDLVWLALRAHGLEDPWTGTAWARTRPRRSCLDRAPLAAAGARR